jgi:hypothetical protein
MTDANAPRLIDTARRLADALQPADLDGTLSQITRAAVEVLPDAQYASITVRHADGRLETRAPTDEMLVELDKAQYSLQEGPCYAAATEGLHVISSNLAADARFPQYATIAISAGIRAQAGLRLFDTGKSQAALNLYSTRVGAFEDFESLAALFSHHAATAIAYAGQIQNLNEAVQTRTTIGQAVGIVMERYGLSDDRAFAFLARLSMQRNLKLRLVAQELIAESDSRSNGEPPPGPPR